jgi:hypothetical protein
MQKWEYVTEEYGTPLGEYSLNNEYGRVGWELVSVLARTSFGETHYLHFFKRPLGEKA